MELCGVEHPETGEACTWSAGHKRALIDPIATRDRSGPLVDHSWAVPPLAPGALLRQGTVRWVD